jgi:hypothetical protein
MSSVRGGRVHKLGINNNNNTIMSSVRGGRVHKLGINNNNNNNNNNLIIPKAEFQRKS